MAANASLAPLTTFRVGGPADWLVETRNSEEMVSALKLARREGVPVTLLGGGSNVLIADAGVRGLVIRPRGGAIDGEGAEHVRADAAVTINGLVRWTIMHGVAGLEAWAGTPGTVGGAIFGNAHFGGRLIGDLVVSVRLVDRERRDARCSDGADGVRLRSQPLAGHGRSAVVGDVPRQAGRSGGAAGHRPASLAYRKRTQPLDTPSAGCIFQNPDPDRDRVPEGIPWSAGALVDRAGLKGSAAGGARVSPTHGNFIVNDGSATATDIRRLIDRCRDEVRERFGVELREEIVYLGDWN